MFKVVPIVFVALFTLSYGQYLRQQHPPAQTWGRSGAAWGGNAAYRGGNVGYTGWSQPGAYAGGYRAAVAPVAYGGAYGSAYRGAGYGGAGYRGAGYGGAYGAPAVARVSQPVAVAQPQYYGRQYEDESYKPYSFGYSTVDEYGTQLGRQEVADGSGSVKGSYSYKDPTGQFRQVEYVADAGGFRAEVNTNEAGVVPHKPADVVYNVHNK